jgi:hypothetical protein
MSKSSGEQAHRGYVIRTLAMGKQVKARAFTGSKAVMDAESNSLDGVLKIMRDRLDARDASARGKRQDSIPTTEEFVDALNRVAKSVTEPQRKMLRALYEAPDQTLTATQIATAAGYTRHLTATEKLSKYARLIAEDLGYEPAPGPKGAPEWTTTLATEDERDESVAPAQWRWKLRPQVSEAIERLKMFPPIPVVMAGRPW